LLFDNKRARRRRFNQRIAKKQKNLVSHEVLEARGGIEPPIKVLQTLSSIQKRTPALLFLVTIPILYPCRGILRLERVGMQTGHIRINGRWWILKVREWVQKDGVKKRIDTYPKLRQVRHNENGSHIPTDVQALANLELAKINVGQGQGQSADSVKSYLESYLAAGIGSKTRRKLRDVTIQSYKRDYSVIEDFIPDMQLRQVRTPDINRIFDLLIEDDGDTIRAQSAYNNIKNFLSGAFRSAVGAGLINFNPVTAAHSIGGNEADTYAYTLEEIHNLMTAVDSHTAQAAFMVLTFTGLRSEELKGLRWDDYDREKEVLNIKRTIVFGKVVEDTKTQSSKAPVPVIGIVKKYLDLHLERNSGTGYVFHAPTDPERPINFGHLVWNIVIPKGHGRNRRLSKVRRLSQRTSSQSSECTFRWLP
jgi:integrase